MLNLVRVLAFLVIGCSQVHAQVAVGNCSALAGNNAVTTQASGTFTVSGSNIAIVAWVGFFSATTNPTLVYDAAGANQTMTQIGLLHAGGSTIGLYGLVAPGTTGTKTVTATWTGSASATVNVCSFTGVLQTGGAATFPNYTSSASTGSVTVTSGASDAVVGQMVTTASMTSANQTQVYIENSWVGTVGNYAINLVNPTMTGTGSGTLSAHGASLKAAAGGGPTCSGGMTLRGVGVC